MFAAIDDVATGSIQPVQAFGYAMGAAQIVANEAGVLRSEGATDLVLFDVPDLSVTPGILETAAALPPPEASLFEGFVKSLSAYFDQQVLTDLQGIHGLTVFNLDTFGRIDAIVDEPSAYGFSNVTDPCYVGPFTGGGSVCSTPNSYLFWDQVHPTTAAGELIAADALAAIAPEPSSWAMMTIGFASLVLAGLRIRRGATA
jgi:phospholipase/lecithinase/hemolysin